MKLVIMDRTGHTELEGDTATMIKELEKFMQQGARKAVVAEEPNKEPVYIRTPKDIKKLHEETVISVMPQLAGG